MLHGPSGLGAFFHDALLRNPFGVREDNAINQFDVRAGFWRIIGRFRFPSLLRTCLRRRGVSTLCQVLQCRQSPLQIIPLSLEGGDIVDNRIQLGDPSLNVHKR